MAPNPEWFDAPKLQRRGVRAAVVTLVLLTAAGASAAAFVFLDDDPAPAPPAIAEAPATPPAAQPIAPAPAASPAPTAPIVEDEPGLSPPIELRVEAPPSRRTASAPQAAHRMHFRLPSVGSGLAARWIREGNRLASKGRYQGAVRAFEHAAGVDVHSADAWYGVALCDYELKRHRAASTAVTEALEQDAQHSMANLLAGFLSQERGDAAQARRLYGHYLEREPNGTYAQELVSVLEQLPTH